MTNGALQKKTTPNIMANMEAIAILLFVSLGGSLLVYRISKDNFNNIDDCEHKNTFTYVEEAIVTCEKTTVTCLDCHKKLSTKTDCR